MGAASKAATSVLPITKILYSKQHEQVDQSWRPENLVRDFIRSTVMCAKPWLSAIHNTVIDGAIVDVVNACQANIKLRKKLEKNETFRSKMHFRKRRHNAVHRQAREGQKSVPFAFLKYLGLSAGKSLPLGLQAQAKLARMRRGHFCIAFPSPQDLQRNVIALHPVARTFQTGFVRTV